MKNTFLLLAGLMFFGSCQKYIDKKSEEAALNVVTNGQWKVTTFTKGSENKSELFVPYSFQFQSNETVDAIRNNRVEKTGTWKVDVAARTITSHFNVTTEPLILLNGVYKITNSTATTVDANQTVNGELWVLHLDKI